MSPRLAGGARQSRHRIGIDHFRDRLPAATAHRPRAAQRRAPSGQRPRLRRPNSPLHRFRRAVPVRRSVAFVRRDIRVSDSLRAAVLRTWRCTPIRLGQEELLPPAGLANEVVRQPSLSGVLAHSGMNNAQLKAWARPANKQPIRRSESAGFWWSTTTQTAPIPLPCCSSSWTTRSAPRTTVYRPSSLPSIGNPIL